MIEYKGFTFVRPKDDPQRLFKAIDWARENGLETPGCEVLLKPSAITRRGLFDGSRMRIYIYRNDRMDSTLVHEIVHLKQWLGPGFQTPVIDEQEAEYYEALYHTAHYPS